MKNTLALAVAGALALPTPAPAQSPVVVEQHILHAHDILADAAAARAGAEAHRVWAEDFAGSLAPVIGARIAASKPVKGAPYSADVTTENNQTLADGNVIARKTTGRVYRDGEGRTRQETVVDGAARSIQIGDPVEGKSVMLLPQSKRAVPLPRAGVAGESRDLRILRLGEREIRIENGRVSVDGKVVASPGKVELTANGKSVRIEGGEVWIDGKPMAGAPKVPAKRSEDEKAGDGAVREEVHVRVIRAGDGEFKELAIGVPPVPPVPPAPPVGPAPPPPVPPMPGPLGMHIDGALARAKVTTSALGTKEFDGVKAEGKSTLRTIPAGEIGNRNPIVVTTETWHSPELQVTVYSRTSDPRYGETIYRLSNIRRGEPAADLFKVPEDYVKGGKRGKG